MWESKSFQSKLPIFKQELAEDGRASFSASYVKILRCGSCPLRALFAKIMIKDKLIMALIDSGSSVSTAIQVQLQKFTSEITTEFLVTKNEMTPCLLGMEFLYDFDCILNP